MTEKICITCEKRFKVSERREQTAKYCSTKCRKHYKYQYNDSFFESIDSEEKAYWLGFIFADGCVKDSKNALQIFLKSTDKGHLEKLRHSLNGNFPIRSLEKKVFGKVYKQVEVSIWSKKMADDLRIFLKDKETLPSEVEGRYFNHFFRGLSDGDGSISVNKKRNRLQFFLLAKHNLLKKIQEKLTDIIGKDFKSTIGWTKGISYMSYSGKNKVKLLLDYIYNQANIYLDRKYRIYKGFYEKSN